MAPALPPDGGHYDPEEGGVERGRPYGLLPRLPGVAIKEEDRDLALVLAEYLFPGVEHIDQLNDEQKPWWILVSGRLLSGDKAIARYVEAFSKVFLPSVDAQIGDTMKRQEFDFADKGRRAAAEEVERRNREERAMEEHKARLARIAQEGVEEEKREKQKRADGAKRAKLDEAERIKHLELEEEERKIEMALTREERKTRLKNRDRRENLAMAMAAVTFLGALVVFLIGLLRGEGWVIGGSGLTGAIALISMFVQMLLSEPKASPPSTSSP
jgi:hypothetical protein